MSESTTFEILLKDGVSAVAKVVGKSFSELAKAGAATAKAVASVGSVAKGIGSGLGHVAFGINQVADVAGRAYVAIERLAEEQSRLTQQRGAFERFGQAGAKAFEDLRKYGNDAGLPFDRVGEAAGRLLSVTGDLGETQALLKLASDGAAAGKLGADGVMKLVDTFAELKNKAGAGAGDLEKFAKDAGNINLKELYSKISEASGLSEKRIEKLVKDGKLSFNELLQGFQLLNQAKLGSGELGAGAVEDAAKRIDAQLNRVENAWEAVKERVVTGLFTPEVIKGVDEFTRSLVEVGGPIDVAFQKFGDLYDYMKGVNWDAVTAGVIGVGTALGVSFVPAMIAAGTAAIAAAPGVIAATAPFLALAAAVAAVVYWWDPITEFFSGIGSAIADFAEGAWDALKVVFSWTPLGTIVSNWGEVTQFFSGVGTKIADVASRTTEVLVQAFSWTPLGLIVSHWDEVTGFFASLPGAFTTFGSDIIGGLIEGLTGGVGRVTSFMTDLAGSAVSAFKDTLGIHSPSKVFEGMGKNTVEGYELGVERASSDIADTTADMAQRATQAPLPKPEKQGGADEQRGRGIPSVNTFKIDIQVNGADASSPRELAETIALTLSERLRMIELQGI